MACGMQVDARVLGPPELKYAGAAPVQVGPTGAWNLARLSFVNPQRIVSFGVVSFCRKDLCGGGLQKSLSVEVGEMWPIQSLHLNSL